MFNFSDKKFQHFTGWPFGYVPAVLTNSRLCSAWVNTFHSLKGAASSCLDFPFILHLSVPLKMGMQYSSSPQQEQGGATNTLIKIMGCSFVNCAMQLAFKARFEVFMEWWFVSLTICFSDLLFQLLNQILSFSYIYSKFVHSGGWKPHAMKTTKGTVAAQT